MPDSVVEASDKKEILPAWALKIVSAIGLILLSSFAAWMTFVSSQLNTLSRDYVELKVNVGAMEKRIESQTSEENRRYLDLKEQMQKFTDRMEAKMDKLLTQRIGSIGGKSGD